MRNNLSNDDPYNNPRFLSLVTVSRHNSTMEVVDTLKELTSEAWGLMADNGVKPVFATISPDHERTVLTIESEQAKTKALEIFKKAGFKLSEARFTGEPIVTKPGMDLYEIRLSVERRAYPA